MNNHSIIKRIVNLHDGLCNGLSKFSGPSRVAMLYALGPDKELHIYDPMHLLRGHEPRLEDLYFGKNSCFGNTQACLHKDLSPCDNLGLSGLICFGGQSATFYYQMWFTEHHVDMCSIGPTERWLEHACRLMCMDMQASEFSDLGTSNYVLQEFAPHAVRDHIVDIRNLSVGPDTRLRIYSILETVLAISKTREEGIRPEGELIFVEPSLIHKVHFLATFSEYERPALKDTKHIRKLLQSVETNGNKLVSDGRQILGIGMGRMPDFSVVAEYHGNHGFLRVQDEMICSFSDGGFQSTTRQANLVALEEALLEYNLGQNKIYTIMKTVGEIVRSARERKHGCTLVLDFGSPLANISAQHLETPLDLRRHVDLGLAKSLAKVDGALHIDLIYLKLHAFAALLDGRAVASENRARGARYNSALRFTAEHTDTIVVVVSSDRPISVILNGSEIKGKCMWEPACGSLSVPPLLKDWLKTDS